MKRVRNARSKPLVLLAGVIVLACLVSVGFAAAQPIDHQMRAWKLLPEPEKLTELYFTKPNQIPTTYTPGDIQLVHFTVHNLEYQTVTYHYTVDQVSENDNHKLPLATGSFTLSQNQYRNQTVSVTLGDLDRSQVRITLQPVNETIDYWVTGG